jgi:hypothetical protein
MAGAGEFARVFTQLRGILKPFEKHLVVRTDEPDNYYLNTPQIGPNKQPICFAFLSARKNYVSFHLMPVYGCPDLVEAMSPELKVRMQGKACFNFKKADATLFKELKALTKKGFERFTKAGYI